MALCHQTIETGYMLKAIEHTIETGHMLNTIEQTIELTKQSRLKRPKAQLTKA
jgi:hypothetical protein